MLTMSFVLLDVEEIQYQQLGATEGPDPLGEFSAPSEEQSDSSEANQPTSSFSALQTNNLDGKLMVCYPAHMYKG